MMFGAKFCRECKYIIYENYKRCKLYYFLYVIIIDNIIVAPFTRIFFVFCVCGIFFNNCSIHTNEFCISKYGLAFYRHKTELLQALPGSRFCLRK
jgi:hypothetical protein